MLTDFTYASELITQVRNTRKQKNLSPKEKVSLFAKDAGALKSKFNDVIIRLANLDKFDAATSKIENSSSFLIGNVEFYNPFSAGINVAEEKDRLMKELDYNKGFLKSVQAKLANERFVSNAKPEILENEKKKQADAEAKIRSIEEMLGSLK